MFNSMKKMFFKILMLLAVTAGMGVAVTSCKDTSDDLQDQIDQIQKMIQGENANLQDLLDENIGNLERMYNGLSDRLDLINSCECDEQALQRQLREMQNLLAQRMDSLHHRGEVELDTATQMLNRQIINLRAYLTENYVTKQMLRQAVDTLNKAIEEARCKCDFSDILRRLSDVEQVAADALSLAEQADSAANNARTAARNAQLTADSAMVLAGKAHDLAGNAYILAQTAKTIAEAADSTANAALRIAKANRSEIGSINRRLGIMSDSLKTAYDNAARAVALAEANSIRINALDSLTDVHGRKIGFLGNKLDSLEHNYNVFKDTVTNNINRLYILAATNLQLAKDYTDEQIALLKLQVATNTQNIDSLCQVVDSICNLTTNMQETDKRLEERIDSLAGVTRDLGLVDEDLQAQIDSLCEVMVATEARVKAIEDTYVTRDEFTATVDSICGLIDATNVRIDSLELAYQLADELLQDQIDDLSRRLDGIDSNLQEISETIQDVENLKERMEAVETTLANMITGIIVQGTYNPAFGMVNLPANINTNVLIAYYGEANNDIYFPTYRTGNYVHPSEALTEKDVEMIGGENSPLFSSGDKLLINEDSNAGTLYVTVNPNTVDFTGETLILENSQTEESGIKLGELKKSDKVLEFGFTRAADNGFYEAPAYVEADKIGEVQKINFNRDAIKNAVKDIMKNRQNANFVGIAGDMYDLLMDTKLDANAVKATWTDGNDETHNVYSNYSLAATAVKPLSFETLKDLNVITIPGYEVIMDFINTVTDKVRGAIDDTGIFESMRELQEKGLAINIRKADLIDVDQVKGQVNLLLSYVINKKWTVGGQTYYFQDYLDGLLFYVDGEGNSHTVSVDPSASITVESETITVKQIIDVPTQMMIDYAVEYGIGEINRVDDEQNTMIITITDFLGDVCDFMDDVYDLKADFIDANIDKLSNKLKDLLDRGNTYLAGLVNGIHARLQPVLIISTDDGSHLLSSAKNAPLRVGNSVTFVPTTWTIELIVPICKKHIAVTNVFKGSASAQDGDPECKSALEAINNAENMNQVLDGNVRQFTVDGFQAGYTYEVAYSALDFHGKIATKKYYITPNK